MKNARVVFAVSIGVGLAAACGGSSNTPPANGGDAAGSGSSSGSGSSDSSVRDGAVDATNPVCGSAADCAGGTVCCELGCQAPTACGIKGNRQLCASSTDCPAGYPVCRGGPPTMCRGFVFTDAGLSEAGSAADTGALDAGPDVPMPLDAPAGG